MEVVSEEIEVWKSKQGKIIIDNNHENESVSIELNEIPKLIEALKKEAGLE